MSTAPRLWLLAGCGSPSSGELVGGERSYWACIPSKSLLRPGKAVQGAREAGARGEVDVEAALAWRDFMASNHSDAGQGRWLANRRGGRHRGRPGRLHLYRGHTRIDHFCARGSPRRPIRANQPAAAHHGQQYFVVSQHAEPDFLVLNTHRRLFSDRRLRQAVNYAIDRQALARLGSGYGTADRPTSQYLPPGMPGHGPSTIYPLTPDLAKARALASGHGRTVVLYDCNYAACRQQAQIVSDDLAAIGLHVEIKIFDHATLEGRISRPNEPFDLTFGTWLTDYPDPEEMLTGMLAAPGGYPTFDDPNFVRELGAAGHLTGPQRYVAFGKLALRLARDAAPIVAYGNEPSQEEFFSPRIGCQTYSFYVGVDLAALCIRPQHR